MSGNLARHKRIHNGHKPFKCDVCQERFPFSGSLTVHKRIHTGHKPYECDVYNKKFSGSASLAEHQITELHKKQAFKCHVCSKTFSHKGNLKGHMKKSHLMERAQRCSICERQIFQLNQLSHNDQASSSENHYKCNVCRELESSTATGIGYICCICDVVFETANELENHMSVYDNELEH